MLKYIEKIPKSIIGILKVICAINFLDVGLDLEFITTWHLYLPFQIILIPIWLICIAHTYGVMRKNAQIEREKTRSLLKLLGDQLKRSDDLLKTLSNTMMDNDALYNANTYFIILNMRSRYRLKLRTLDNRLRSTYHYQNEQDQIQINIKRLVRINDDMAGIIRNDEMRTSRVKPQNQVNLPANVMTAVRDLKIVPDKIINISLDDYKRDIFRPLVKQYHPDNGGSANTFQSMQNNLSVIENYIKNRPAI